MPVVKLVEEHGRDELIELWMEQQLLTVTAGPRLTPKGKRSRVGWEPFRTILLIMLDSGLRPGEIFRMRWENIHWDKGLIFNPRGKSRKSRRYVPLTQRVKAALLASRERASEGWVFPSKKAQSGHITGHEVSKQWLEAKRSTGIPGSVVLYCARHRFSTHAMEGTGNVMAVTDAMGARPVILRTLDVGADKPLPALPQPPEANPALGVRGLRLQLLRRPDLLADQVRAALRVAAKHPLRLMFPMVSTLDEVRQAKAILAQAVSDIDAAGADGPQMQVGIMVEVPAAAIGADLLAREVDFFSLGTNDLTQYLFAADRTNPELGPLADSLHPAVLQMIDQVVKAARRHGRWVGVCGEMASDLWAVPLLVGLGVDELSVHPPMVARIKATVRQLNAADCAEVAAAALELEGGQAVRHLLEQRHLEPSSLRPRTDR